MQRPVNIVLLIIDSLRAQSLGGNGLTIPFQRRLNAETIAYRRAYATECWTLPSHVSMFTGLLPSEHGAHFQTMAYEQSAPTIAEVLGARGYHTELVTRNFVFDGTIDGATRGFRRLSRPLAELARTNLMGLFFTLAKPRVRRHIRRTGFFHRHHAEQRAFVRTFARSLMPADELALARVLDVMAAQRRARRPYFICCNLYDVHAPYPPARASLLQPWDSLSHAAENVAFPVHLAKLGQHAYLREGFHLSPRAQQILRERYHRAIELMDAKLAVFYEAALSSRLLDDTLLIVTSDHGEAFGEHGLYLHDASVYDTHLHVPLWMHHPDLAPAAVDDIVSTKDLFSVMLAVSGQRPLADTILGAGYRSTHPIALAEHFHYPHRADMAARYRQNLLAAIVGEEKFVLRRNGLLRYDLSHDPDELDPTRATIDDVTAAIRQSGATGSVIDVTTAHFRRWQDGERTQGVSRPAHAHPVARPALA